MIPNNSRERKRSKVYVPVEKNNHVILEIDNPRKEIDFQTHFVIKKKVELPVTAPKTVIESENIFVGRDAHKKVPVSVSHQKPQVSKQKFLLLKFKIFLKIFLTHFG